MLRTGIAIVGLFLWGCSGGDAVPSNGKIVFITSEVYSAALTTYVPSSGSGLAAADEICAARANAAGLPSAIWRSWISDETTDAIDRLSDDGRAWYLLNGQRVATGLKNLIDSSLRHEINVTEYGQEHLLNEPLPFDFANPELHRLAWTGTGASGKKTGNHCQGWSSAAMTPTSEGPARGLAHSAGPNWTEFTLGGCNLAAALYCFQQ